MNKKCTKCGTKNISENNFCEQCGSIEFEDIKTNDLYTIENIAPAVTTFIFLCVFIAVIVKNLSYSTKEKIYSTIGIEKESSSTGTASFNGISSSEDCDYDKASDYFNREDPSQVDPELTSMLKVCSLKNVSLHLDGKILTCKNDGVSTTIDGSYKSVIIGGTQWFSNSDYTGTNIIASSCRPL